MNDALLEAFRHNSWATRHLLAACRGLSEEQLSTPAPGSYGGILATFNHIVHGDGGYVGRLTGSAPAWVRRDDSNDLDELAARVDEVAQLWDRFLSGPVDAERMIVAGEALEVAAGVIVAQALHHGNAHREQISAMLTSFGIEPPDIQAWGWAWATGRVRDRVAGD